MASAPPSSPPEPLDLDAVKLNLRVDSTAEDEMIQDLIVEAREFVEVETGLLLVPKTLTETARHLGRWIDLSSWPVSAITAIRYPLQGVMTPLPPTSWATSYLRRPIRIIPTAWAWGGVAGYAYGGLGRAFAAPTLPIEIDVAGGYATPDDVPARAKRVMHLVIAHWYSNRSAVEAGARAAAIEMPIGVTELVDKLRLMRV